ncbi:hypothetical protein IT413_01435 [Candidatus Peregrinibacteria bacterium]|nr:hypothetical protein [Candidatus Peregrinibacteria bacterium]
MFTSSPEENHGSQTAQTDGVFDDFIWKKSLVEVGNGGPYRTAQIERREPTFLGNLVLNHRRKLMALGVLLSLGGAAKAVDVLWPEARTPEDNAHDATVFSVKVGVNADVCASQAVEHCYVNDGNGPVKQVKK